MLSGVTLELCVRAAGGRLLGSVDAPLYWRFDGSKLVPAEPRLDVNARFARCARCETPVRMDEFGFPLDHDRYAPRRASPWRYWVRLQSRPARCSGSRVPAVTRVEVTMLRAGRVASIALEDGELGLRIDLSGRMTPITAAAGDSIALQPELRLPTAPGGTYGA